MDKFEELYDFFGMRLRQAKANLRKTANTLDQEHLLQEAITWQEARMRMRDLDERFVFEQETDEI